MRAGPAAELLRPCPSRCPPRTFLPALCKIFLDESAPDNVLEVTARAITYYLDVSAECTRRIVGVDGAIKALCNRLVVVELNNRTSRDLAEQCVKVGGRLSKYWSINQGAVMYLPKGNGHLGRGLPSLMVPPLHDSDQSGS